MFIYIYKYIFVYIFANINVYVYICICLCICIYMYIRYSQWGGGMRCPLPFFQNSKKLPCFFWRYTLIVFINDLNFLFKMHSFKSIWVRKFPNFSLRDLSVLLCQYNNF